MRKVWNQNYRQTIDANYRQTIEWPKTIYFIKVLAFLLTAQNYRQTIAIQPKLSTAKIRAEIRDFSFFFNQSNLLTYLYKTAFDTFIKFIYKKKYVQNLQNLTDWLILITCLVKSLRYLIDTWTKQFNRRCLCIALSCYAEANIKSHVNNLLLFLNLYQIYIVFKFNKLYKKTLIFSYIFLCYFHGLKLTTN